MSAERKVRVHLTANFEANLKIVEAFLDEADAPQAYEDLLTELSESVLPNLERFPRLGRPFLNRGPDSAEAATRIERLRARLARLAPDGDIREYITAHYVILYAHIGAEVYLLSIRHHRQLSFDFNQFWPEVDN